MLDRLNVLFKDELVIDEVETIGGNKFHHINNGDYHICTISPKGGVAFNKFIPSKLFKNSFYAEAFEIRVEVYDGKDK